MFWPINIYRGWSTLGGNGNTSPPNNRTERYPVTAAQADGTVDIEMQDLGAQNGAQNDGQNAAHNQTTQTNNKNRDNVVWFSILLGWVLFLTSVGLFPSKRGTPPPIPTWTREGSDEVFTPIQVIFASYSKRYIWARFTVFMSLQVVTLGLVRGYATWAVLITSATTKKILMWLKDVFFAVAVVLSAVSMWGWLLWMRGSTI
jgi:hypothetical protein